LTNSASILFVYHKTFDFSIGWVDSSFPGTFHGFLRNGKVSDQSEICETGPKGNHTRGPILLYVPQDDPEICYT
jgi:hypothetical protein